jgi:LysM repeat protein
MDRNQDRENKPPYNEQVNAGTAGGVVSEYIVEEKDTISDIARRYGLTLEEIMAANPGIDEPADMVKPGLKIKIPKRLRG